MSATDTLQFVLKVVNIIEKVLTFVIEQFKK